MSAYQQRVNAERLARQAPAAQKTANEILKELKTIENYLYWALDPEDEDGGLYDCRNLIEHAHILLDLGHDYRAALVANPPPKDDEDAPPDSE